MKIIKYARKSIEKVINFLLRSLSYNSMHEIPENEKSFHMAVVRQSFLTYLQFRAQGLEVTANPLEGNKRTVGGSDKIYPDIIAWRPSSLGSTSGTTLIVEQIETNNSFSSHNIDIWRRLYQLRNVQFILVVSNTDIGLTRNLLRESNISPTRLQTYTLNVETNQFVFRDVPL